MASLEEMLGLDPQSPDMQRAEFLVQNDRKLLRRLVEVRIERGLSQEQVGELMGVSQPTVAAFEAHDSNPRLSTIRRYAHAVRALVDHKVESDAGQLADGRWRFDLVVTMPQLGAMPESRTILISSLASSGAAPFPGLDEVCVDSERADFALAA